jgi:hypothetical protein
VEVRFDARLRWPVVVRADDEDRRRTGCRRLAGERDRLGRVVGSGAEHDRRGDGLAHGPAEVELLPLAEHRRLAGGARHDETVGAVLHEPTAERGRAVEIERAARVERCDHRGEHGAEPASHHATSFDRSSPSVLRRSSCSSNHTVWYESIIGLAK